MTNPNFYTEVTKKSDDDLREYVRLTLVEARELLSRKVDYAEMDSDGNPWNLEEWTFSRDYTRADFRAEVRACFNKLRHLTDRTFGSYDERTQWFREEINKDPKNAVSPLNELFKSDRGKPTTFSKVELTEIEEVEALMSGLLLRDTADSYCREQKEEVLDSLARSCHALETVRIPRLERAWKWGGRDDSGRAEQTLSELHEALRDVRLVRSFRKPKLKAVDSDWSSGTPKYVDDITGKTGKTDWAGIAFYIVMGMAVLGGIMTLFGAMD